MSRIARVAHTLGRIRLDPGGAVPAWLFVSTTISIYPPFTSL